MGSEKAAIEFVQKNAPSVPVPTVLEYYVDEMVYRSYTLLLSVSGVDLNVTWKTLNKRQKLDVANQVAKHIHTLAQFKSDKLQSVDQKWVFEPFLSIQPRLRSCRSTVKDFLLNPDESQVYEKIWGAEQNEFVFYHGDLGPTNIKIIVKKKKR